MQLRHGYANHQIFPKGQVAYIGDLILPPSDDFQSRLDSVEVKSRSG